MDGCWKRYNTRRLPGSDPACDIRHEKIDRLSPEHGADVRFSNRPDEVKRFQVSVHDADGELVSSAYSIGAIIDNALRQRRSAPEAKRILATLLFTDVVGSTERAERLGDDRWRALLDEHYSAIRTEVVRHNGIEVNTTGDGMLIRFDAPLRAVECARAIVASVQRLGLSIRTGRASAI